MLKSFVFNLRSANWRTLVIALMVVATITMALVAVVAPPLLGLSHPLPVAVNWNSIPPPP